MNIIVEYNSYKSLVTNIWWQTNSTDLPLIIMQKGFQSGSFYVTSLSKQEATILAGFE